jgi:hypothetical protein
MRERGFVGGGVLDARHDVVVDGRCDATAAATRWWGCDSVANQPRSGNYKSRAYTKNESQITYSSIRGLAGRMVCRRGDGGLFIFVFSEIIPTLVD